VSNESGIRLDLLWATELVITHVHDEIAAFDGESSSRLERIPRALRDRACQAIGRLSTSDPNPTRIVRVRREVWTSDSDLRLAGGSTAWQVIVVLALRLTPMDAVVPSLFVHDPRAGVECASTPGSPYGRPLTVPISTGLMLAMPGWLEWSVQLFPANSGCDVLLIDLDGTSPVAAGG
jgi:hypothetical protein